MNFFWWVTNSIGVWKVWCHINILFRMGWVCPWPLWTCLSQTTRMVGNGISCAKKSFFSRRCTSSWIRNNEFGKCVFEVIFFSPEKWHKTVRLKKKTMLFIKWCKNKLNKTSYEMITYKQISEKKTCNFHWYLVRTLHTWYVIYYYKFN